jgi:hypothetical protein
LPVGSADRGGLAQKIRACALIEAPLDRTATFEELVDSTAESASEIVHERDRAGRQHSFCAVYMRHRRTHLADRGMIL